MVQVNKKAFNTLLHLFSYQVDHTIISALTSGNMLSIGLTEFTKITLI